MAYGYAPAVDFSAIGSLADPIIDAIKQRNTATLLQEWAGSQLGATPSRAETLLSMGQPAQPTNLPRMAQPGQVGDYARAIQSNESGGNYAAVGPTHPKLGRALGAYQVMEANVGPWTKEVLGVAMSPQDFLASKQAQDAVFNAKFGENVRKYGNPQDAASVWFTGRPLAEGRNRRDVLGTTGQAYVDKFSRALGGGGPQVAQADVPASGATETQFRVPGTGQEVPTSPPTTAQPSLATSGVSPQQREVLMRMLANPATRTAAIAEIQRLRTADAPVAGVNINGRLVNPKTGALIADYSDTNRADWQLKDLPDGRQVLFNPRTQEVKPAPIQSGPAVRNLTTPEERAQYGVDPNYRGPVQIDAKGAIHMPGKTAEVPAPEKEYDKKVSGAYADDFNEIRQGEQSATKTKNALRLMTNLIKDENFYSGFGGNVAKKANQALIAAGMKDANATSAVEAFEGLANEVTMGKLGGKLGAGVSNTDVSFIQKMGPQLAHTQAGNQLLIQFTDRMMDRQIEIAKLARDYAKRNGGRLDMGFDDELRQLAERSPLFSETDVAAAEAAAQQISPKSQTLWQNIFGDRKKITAPNGATIERLD